MTTSELNKLHSENFFCTRCYLSPDRSDNCNVVVGRGKPSQIVFIGEAPGGGEDLEGKPFVGRCGKLLDKMLSEAKIDREDVYITNVVKCRPTASRGEKVVNRPPTPKEIQTCKTWLYRELKLLQPRIIVTLGRVATQLLLKHSDGLGRHVGVAHDMSYTGLRDFVLVPCWHPSYILRMGGEYKVMTVTIFRGIKELWQRLEGTSSLTAGEIRETISTRSTVS